VEFDALRTKVRNWGRWGDDDERGTLNLITPSVVARAAACVKTGKRFSLALPLSHNGPQTGQVPGRVNPLRTMTMIDRPVGRDPGGVRASDDVVHMALQAATHWDALSHISYGGRLYNGFDSSSITDAGAARCGIQNVCALVTRGVLLDVARAKDVERLDPGYAITPDDLDAADRAAVQAGDVVLIRTGQMQLLKAGDKQGYGAPSPGPGMSCALWFHDRDIAAVATDTYAFEVFPPEERGVFLPLHVLDLVEMGMLQGQNFDLEELAADCASDGVYEFLLSATPEPFVHAVGAPVVPVAIK
jgi:kynurenine formamidase